MLLPTGTGFAEVTAGITKPWGGSLDAFLRGELGWHPADPLAVFGFAQADLQGAQAGIGARVDFP